MKTKLMTVVALGALVMFSAKAENIDFQKLIDEAAAKGGGRVVVGPGIHHTGTLHLKSHVELHFEEGAVLLASTNIADYAEFPKDICPVAPGCMFWTLIMAWDAKDIAIISPPRLLTF